MPRGASVPDLLPPHRRADRTAQRPTLPSAEPAAARASVPRLNSGQLFGPAQEVHIEHGGAVYRLRITSLGKLILTK